ncbi:MAG: hypothetical protein J5614_03665 [Paludibacteraceae bacterium]|nr:hypothetical protein [Paludibacteraceae bacterium]
MKYTQFMRGCGNSTADEAKIAEYTGEIKDLQTKVDELTEQLDNVQPEIVQSVIRTDDEFNEVIETLIDLGKKYFEDVPLTSVPGPMLQNIPQSLMKSIRLLNTHPEYPDILNPAMMLYLCCLEDPADAIGRYLEILKELMDDNAQAIHEDAERYLESFLEDDDDEDVDEDDADEAGNVTSPGEYLEQDHEFDKALIEDVPVDEDDDRDVPDEADFPTVNPDEVDVIVEADCEVIPIDPAQENGEIPYDE